MRGGLTEVRTFFDQTNLYLHKRYGIWLRQQIIRNLVQARSPRRVLDVGCGDGSLSMDFVNQASHLSLIDLSPNMLALAKLNHETAFQNASTEIEYFNGDFSAFESSEKFDLILVIGVLAHVPNIDAIFEKLRRLVASDGIIVIQYSDGAHPLVRIRRWLHMRKSNYSLNLIRKRTIDDLCAKNELAVVSNTRFNFSFFAMRFFNDRLLYRFQSWLITKKIFAFVLTDVMVVLNKTGRNNHSL